MYGNFILFCMRLRPETVLLVDVEMALGMGMVAFFFCSFNLQTVVTQMNWDGHQEERNNKVMNVIAVPERQL